MDTEPTPDRTASAFDMVRDVDRQERDEQIADEIDQVARAAEMLDRNPPTDSAPSD